MREIGAAGTSAKRAVLFDFDGVIAPSAFSLIGAWEGAFREQGLPFNSRSYLLLEGRRSPDIARALLQECGADESLVEAIVEAKNRLAPPLPTPIFYEGIEELVQFVEARGLRMAIVSGGRRSRITSKDYAPVTGRFTTIVSADDVTATKPDPEPYLTAARELEVTPEECLVIENAPLGIESARRAGMTCFAVSSTLPRADLSAADAVFDDLHAVHRKLSQLFAECALKEQA